MNRRLLAALATSVLLLAACGDSADTADTGDNDVDAATSAEPTSCPAAPTTVEAPEDATTDLMTKPEITIPDNPPPTTLQVSDIVEGDGELACSGEPITVQYVGVTYATGKQFDASWDRGEPFSFQLGGGQVIQGWDQGLVGMRQGGRRQLVIPPDLGYGEQGAGPDIPPGATLVFVVDLVGVGG